MEAKTMTLVERLRVIIRGAYNEGFSEGMREHTSHKGGKIWQESSASKHAEELASLLEAAEKALEPFAGAATRIEREISIDALRLGQPLEASYEAGVLARSVYQKIKGDG